MKSVLPLGGAVVGGGVGALGGPATGAAGAGLGYAAGQLYSDELSDADVVDAVVDALGQKEVQQLVEKTLHDKKAGGFFDSILDGVYSLIRIVAIVGALWFLVPIVYARFLHKEVKKNKEKIDNGHSAK